MFDKKWFRFIIFFVLLIGTFVAGFVVLFSDAMSGTNEIGGGLLIGVFSVAGQLFAFLAFDMLYNIEKGFLRVLRMLFICISALIFVVIGVTSSLIYASSAMILSPWLRGFGGMWLAYGVISFYLYYFADYNFWNNALIPFLQLIAFVGAYFLSVIFAYVGDAAGAFFYGYMLLIACAVAFIIMCIILKKFGLPFDIDLSLPAQKANLNKAATPANIAQSNACEEVDNRSEDKNGKALLAAVDRAILRALREMLSIPDYGQISEAVYTYGTNIKSYITLSGSVKVTGCLTYEITTTSVAVTANDIEKDMQYCIDKFNGYVQKYSIEEVDALSDKYMGYDNGVNVDANVKLQLKR